MIRCAWCGARNYAIDMWCTRCHRHLDWQPMKRRRGALAHIFHLHTACEKDRVVIAGIGLFEQQIRRDRRRVVTFVLVRNGRSQCR